MARQKNGVGGCRHTLWPPEHSLPWMASNDRVWRNPKTRKMHSQASTFVRNLGFSPFAFSTIYLRFGGFYAGLRPFPCALANASAGIRKTRLERILSGERKGENPPPPAPSVPRHFEEWVGLVLGSCLEFFARFNIHQTSITNWLDDVVQVVGICPNNFIPFGMIFQNP